MPTQCDIPNINDLFTGDVRTVVAPLIGRLDDLRPEERAQVASAVEKRRREYATGRRLARELLAHFDVHDYPLLNDADRLPIWPENVIGSISHCDACCVVALAEKTDSLRSLSVDVEPQTPLEEALWSTIATRPERRWIDSQDTLEPGRLMRLLFSAKESVYKCLFPITRIPLEFSDVQLSLDMEHRRFTATLDASCGIEHDCPGLSGRWLWRDDHVFTAVQWRESADG